jgi:hypothetical protein
MGGQPLAWVLRPQAGDHCPDGHQATGNRAHERRSAHDHAPRRAAMPHQLIRITGRLAASSWRRQRSRKAAQAKSSLELTHYRPTTWPSRSGGPELAIMETMTQMSSSSESATETSPAVVPDPRVCTQESVSSSGITFRSCNGTEYISLNYHRSPSGTTYKKSIWDIPRPDECHFFCIGSILLWKDDGGNCWAIGKDAEVVMGTLGERLAFFPRPTNQTDPWHGFPVGGRRALPVHRRPPDGLLRQWLESKWITKTTYDRLLGGRL